jgi:methylmalonyl-CoA/ethylmalonyl-CoA epimerase
MSIALNQLGQVMLPVDDVDAAEVFYAETLGLRKLYRFGDLLFFDCAGVRLLVEKAPAQPFVPSGSILYFRVADISLAYREFQSRGVAFSDQPHLIAPMEDHDLWMAFFKDPAGNTLALMQEAPKGYQPTSW